jgi:hypothetical protein
MGRRDIKLALFEDDSTIKLEKSVSFSEITRPNMN